MQFKAKMLTLAFTIVVVSFEKILQQKSTGKEFSYHTVQIKLLTCNQIALVHC